MGFMEGVRAMFGKETPKPVERPGVTPEQYQTDVLGPNAEAELAANQARAAANEREVNAAIEAGDMTQAAKLTTDLQAGIYSEAALPKDDVTEEVEQSKVA